MSGHRADLHEVTYVTADGVTTVNVDVEAFMVLVPQLRSRQGGGDVFVVEGEIVSPETLVEP